MSQDRTAKKKKNLSFEEGGRKVRACQALANLIRNTIRRVELSTDKKVALRDEVVMREEGQISRKHT